MMYHLGTDLSHRISYAKRWYKTAAETYEESIDDCLYQDLFMVSPINNLVVLEFSHGTGNGKIAKAMGLLRQAVETSRETENPHCTAMNNLAALLEHTQDAGNIREAIDL